MECKVDIKFLWDTCLPVIQCIVTITVKPGLELGGSMSREGSFMQFFLY